MHNYFSPSTFTRLLILLSLVILSACSSTPSVEYTPKGKDYFTQHPAKYKDIIVVVRSANENKAIKSGYMSNEELKEYIERRIANYLSNNNLQSDDKGITVTIDFNAKRAYSWGGSSMAVFGYSANVRLKNSQGESLGNYNDFGQLKDTSIAGNLKTIFGTNKPSEESEYIDVAVDSLLAKLPQGEK